MDESCSHCGNMTMAMLRSRYLLTRRGGIPLALPCSSSSGRRTTSAQGQGDLRITVRATPSSTSPRASHSSSTSHRLGFPDEYAGSSDRAGPSISFGAPADDGISITASGDELGSGEDDSAALPPSGRVALPESDPELTAMQHCCANTGIWGSVTSAGWDFRSTGKRANSPLRRGSLFSAWSWTRSISQPVSQRSVLSQC